MNERMRFVTDRERELYSMVELCKRYGVSRKTGYKWVARYERDGPYGLRERSRAPHQCPHRIAADVAAAICAGRRQHPSWGLYCYPLTVADQHTRYLLGCHGLLSTKGQGVRPIFERLFREYGLPGTIRTDNGVPFATTGIHGFSQLNVWWIRRGIQHHRIRPASPREHGAHERMHRTLKAATARPPQGHLPAQQRAFNRFRVLYNEERPHQFLRGRTPGSLYRPSPRPYTGIVPPIEYPGHYIPKRVTNAGTIRFKKRLLFIANSLKQQVLGLDEVTDGIQLWPPASSSLSEAKHLSSQLLTLRTRRDPVIDLLGEAIVEPTHKASLRERRIGDPDIDGGRRIGGPSSTDATIRPALRIEADTGFASRHWPQEKNSC